MSKRAFDGDGPTQQGIPAEDYSGFTSDGSNNSAGGFGNISGRKILNPKRIRGGRPGSVKPLPPQPQAQAPPAFGNAQGFGFTFGASQPAQSTSNFNFGGQQATPTPPQTSGFTFGAQQSEPQQQSQGFGFSPAASNPFQSTNSAFGNTPQSTGFQGNIFNIQPTTQSAPQASPFNPFGSNPSNNFGNTQVDDAPKPLFNFGSAATNTGFGSGAQSTSAPSSFSFDGDNSMNAAQPAATSASFSFGTPQSTSASIPTTSATTSTPFKFGDNASTTQNIFSSAAPTANASSAPDASKPLFSFAPATQPATTNIFGSGVSQTPFTSAAQAGQPQLGGNLFAMPSDPKPSTSTASIFGTPAAPSLQKEVDTSKQPDPIESAAAKPPAFTFGATPAISNPPAAQTEQKQLPSFSFGSKPVSSSSAVAKAADVSSTTTGPSSNDGLFKTPSTSIFQTKSAPEQSNSLFSTSAAGGTSKPLFSFQPATTKADAPKPLFSFGSAVGENTTKSDAAVSEVSSKPPMFGSPAKATESTPAFSFQPSGQESSTAKPLFNFQPSGQESSTAKPLFNFKPTAAAPASLSENQEASGQTSQPKISNTAKPLFSFTPTPTSSGPISDNQGLSEQISQTNTSSAATSKPAFNFQPSMVQQADKSPSKPVFQVESAADIPHTKGKGRALSPTKQPAAHKTPIKKAMIPSPEVKEQSSLDHAPKDKDIPVSFAEKWSTLRTGDLPMDEAVDILLHDWILQLEIPENAFTGMNMNQRDDLTWFWQQNSIDNAWNYHIKEYGGSDRNLLEVYRIVLNLKDAVDRYHQKSWSKANLLVNPAIFDERNIRRMSKQNVVNWENRFRSEIKSLRKRKHDSEDETFDQPSPDSAKRTKIDAAKSSSTIKAPIFGAAAKAVSSPSKQAPMPGNSFDRIAGRSSTSVFTDLAPQTRSATAANQKSPGKANLFDSARSSTTDSTASPQRSKTSQLFASIAGKPVEPVAAVAPAPAPVPTKSLFDRISRDDQGKPLREEEKTSPASEEHGAAIDDEESDGHEDHEEDGEEEEESEDDDDAEDETAEGEDAAGETSGIHEDTKANTPPHPPTSSLFSQSVSATAKAKEAATGSLGDNTWKPDSPIRFGKTSQDASNSNPSSKPPVIGFVPKGGMPKVSTQSTTSLDVSSQDTWKAPSNPFGFFKAATPEASTEETKKPEPTSEVQSVPKFTMPKPPTTTSPDPPLSVSSQDTWKAPTNPFGFFKAVENKSTPSSVAPTVTLTAPSPQRPATKALFAMDASDSKSSEQVKPLFSFAPSAKTSDTDSTKDAIPQQSLFSNTGFAAPAKSIFGSSDVTSAPKKPLFDFTKSDTSNTAAAPVSNAWLDFAKGIKSSSPAPSGASVFASLNTSLNPSRASSPAMSAVSTAAGDTDAEQHEDDDAPKEAQLDLGSANAGEENEDLLHSVRAKAYEFYGRADEKKDWTVRGVGDLRVLKNKETGKVRAVLRADQSAKVLLNAGLLSAATYNLMSPKRVNFTVASADGVPSRWFLQVGKEDDAKKLSEIFEGNKAN